METASHATDIINFFAQLSDNNYEKNCLISHDFSIAKQSFKLQFKTSFQLSVTLEGYLSSSVEMISIPIGCHYPPQLELTSITIHYILCIAS